MGQTCTTLDQTNDRQTLQTYNIWKRTSCFTRRITARWKDRLSFYSLFTRTTRAINVHTIVAIPVPHQVSLTRKYFVPALEYQNENQKRLQGSTFTFFLKIKYAHGSKLLHVTDKKRTCNLLNNTAKTSGWKEVTQMPSGPLITWKTKQKPDHYCDNKSWPDVNRGKITGSTGLFTLFPSTAPSGISSVIPGLAVILKLPFRIEKRWESRGSKSSASAYTNFFLFFFFEISKLATQTITFIKR